MITSDFYGKAKSLSQRLGKFYKKNLSETWQVDKKCGVRCYSYFIKILGLSHGKSCILHWNCHITAIYWSIATTTVKFENECDSNSSEKPFGLTLTKEEEVLHYVLGYIVFFY